MLKFIDKSPDNEDGMPVFEFPVQAFTFREKDRSITKNKT